MGILRHSAVFVHPKVQTCRFTPSLAAGGEVSSPVLQSLHREEQELLQPGGTALLEPFLEASKPLHFRAVLSWEREEHYKPGQVCSEHLCVSEGRVMGKQLP